MKIEWYIYLNYIRRIILIFKCKYTMRNEVEKIIEKYKKDLEKQNEKLI